MKRTHKLFVPLAVAATAMPSIAGIYSVEVTRLASNLFRIDGKNFLVETRVCSMPSLRDPAILNSNGSGGTLTFSTYNMTCDVRAVYAKANIPPGVFSVSATHEKDDWYSLDSGFLVLTELCYSYEYYAKSVLSLLPDGSGTIEFPRGATCEVRGMYQKTRL